MRAYLSRIGGSVSVITTALGMNGVSNVYVFLRGVNTR